MSVTILEALQNAEFNLNQSFTVGIAKRQLHNAIVLLEKGYSIYDEVDPLLTEFKNVENVPEKDREG